MEKIVLKPCRRCKQEFCIDSFPSYIHKTGKKAGCLYRSYICKPCQVLESAERYQNNKEKVKLCVQNYHAKNKEKVKEWSSNYYQKNKERVYLKKKLWKINNREKYLATKKRHKQLPHNKIKRSLSNRIKKLLKGDRNRDISIGCDGKSLIAYIESRFQFGMTWENYGWGDGKWVIDHIKPISLFDIKEREERYSANHYSNLQPLWYVQNDAKSDNYDPDHPMGWHGLNSLLSDEDKTLLSERLGYKF